MRHRQEYFPPGPCAGRTVHRLWLGGVPAELRALSGSLEPETDFGRLQLGGIRADCWDLSEFLEVQIRASPIGFPDWQGCLQTAAGRGPVHSMGPFQDLQGYRHECLLLGPCASRPT